MTLIPLRVNFKQYKIIKLILILIIIVKSSDFQTHLLKLSLNIFFNQRVPWLDDYILMSFPAI